MKNDKTNQTPQAQFAWAVYFSEGHDSPTLYDTKKQALKFYRPDRNPVRVLVIPLEAERSKLIVGVLEDLGVIFKDNP